MYILNFVYPSIDGHVDYFHLLAIMKNAAMNTGVQIIMQVPTFKSFENIPRNEIAG